MDYIVIRISDLGRARQVCGRLGHRLDHYQTISVADQSFAVLDKIPANCLIQLRLMGIEVTLDELRNLQNKS